jgi:epoxyqueuosine reductase
MANTIGPVDVRALIRAEALAAGFATVGFTTPGAVPLAGPRLFEFLGQGRHGDMDWMVTHADRRHHVNALWPEARSVVMLGYSYAPLEDPIATRIAANRAVISAYAKARDYHDTVKAALKRVARVMHASSGAEVKVFVDTAPLMEKPLAEAAGLGWQGRHTNLVSRSHGSWLFLGAILTTLELKSDAASADHCGTCRRCLDACPTQAFPADYQLDARRCIAYLTIEYAGHIAEEFRSPIGNRVFGCDDCLAVCPWNSFAQATHDSRMAVRAEMDNPPLRELLVLDDATFRARFRGTPVKRTGRDRVVRNALIAAGNSNDKSLLEVIQPLMTDPAPVVRAMAIWAFARLADAASLAELRSIHAGQETDTDVQQEWRRTTDARQG